MRARRGTCARAHGALHRAHTRPHRPETAHAYTRRGTLDGTDALGLFARARMPDVHAYAHRSSAAAHALTLAPACRRV
eukprot:3734775-Pleurochrysis_carterae.AAC.1